MFRSLRLHLKFASLMAGCSVAGSEVLAQDIGPALDPGQMVGTAGMDVLRQSEEKRAGHTAHRHGAANVHMNARQACARYPHYVAHFGANEPRVRRLHGLCEQLGLMR